jgi:sugar phosphate isomerase/epimerase
MFKGIGIDVTTNRLDVLDRDLARCAAVGFAAAEFNTYIGTVIRSGQVVPAELARVRQILARYPLHYTLHAPVNLRLTRHPELAAQVLESCLLMAAGLGVEVVVYHSAQIALHDPAVGLAPLPTAEELRASWQEETIALRHFARRAAELGLLLAVENRDPHRWEVAALSRHGRPASELATYHQGMRLDLICQQIAEIGSPYLGLCLDVGHAFLAQPYWQDTDYLTAIRRCAPWVMHLHFHDNFGRLDDLSEDIPNRRVFGEADNHMPPGWGRIPLGKTLAILAEAGYAGWVIVELEEYYEDYWEEALANTRALCAPFMRP